MSKAISEIKSAIDSLDVEEARKLLRVALKENPTSEIYYLASKVAISETQKKLYLSKAVELDPFNEDAYTELKKVKGDFSPQKQENNPKTNKQTTFDFKQFTREFSMQSPLIKLLVAGVGVFIIFTVFSAWSNSNKKEQAKEYVNQADALFEDGKYQDAITLYNQAIELDDNNYKVFFNRGIAYYQVGEFDRALGSCQQALVLNKSYVPAYMCLGDSYSEKGDYQSAYSEYTEAIEKDSKNTEAFSKRGLIAYFQFKDYKLAISDFTKVLDITPDATVMLKYRGYAYLNLNQYEDAASDFKLYINETGDSTLYYALGDAYYNNSDYENAIDAYSNGLAYSGKKIPEAYLLIAVSYEKVGEDEKAIQNYNDYLDLDSSDNENTRYACSRVNTLVLNNSSNFIALFFNALIPSCSRFRNSDGSNYTSDDSYYNYDTEDDTLCPGLNMSDDACMAAQDAWEQQFNP